MRRSLVFMSVLALAAAAPVSAQSFNVDLYGPTPALVPSAAYGAAAAQPGVWNAVSCPSGCDNFSAPLVDTSGISTPVTLFVYHLGSATACPDPSISGDDEALLENGSLVDGFVDQDYVALDHLQPGVYDVYGYAGFACGAPGVAVSMTTGVFAPGHEVFHQRTIAATGWNGGFQEGRNYTRIRCSIEAGATLAINMQAEGRMWQGFQIVRVPGEVRPVCFGTSESYGRCPCGPGAFGRGCPSSVAPDGASLDGSGQAHVATDTLRLTATHVPNSPMLFFQGTQFAASAGTESTTFGDGLQCAGGFVVRIATKTASMGTASYPEANDPPISVRSFVPPTGGSRLYQVWYRNAASFCTSATFNLTNAVAVEWQ